MEIKKTKLSIIQAGQVAVEELIKIAKEATKKLAIFDAFEILQRIQEEEDILNEKPKEVKEEKTFKGFAEGRSN